MSSAEYSCKLFKPIFCIQANSVDPDQTEDQSLSKGIKVMERTRMRLQYFYFWGDKYTANKVRVVSLAQDTPIGPPLHPY